MIDSVSANENCGRVVLNSFLIFLPSDALKMCLICNYPCCNNFHGYLASQKTSFSNKCLSVFLIASSGFKYPDSDADDSLIS